MARIFENGDITIDDIINATRETAEAIGKKSAERLEISRKRVEYFDAKAKLSKQYEKYGKLNYKLLNGEEVSDTELALTADKIAELLEKTERLSAELEESRDRINEVVSAASQVAQKAYDEIKKEVRGEGSSSAASDE
ncbi:MAG: hypothetical protein J5964_08340 [Eubacterium sp.]|nr:hypothetical protein [Eubacterium sp.]